MKTTKSIPFAAITPAGCVETCRNLRPDPLTGGLRPVGRLKTVQLPDEPAEDAPALFPVLHIKPALESLRTTYLPNRTLSGEYTARDARLNAEYSAAITRDFTKRIEVIFSEARSRGLLVGTVLCRYRVVSKSGRTLYLSQPIAVSEPYYYAAGAIKQTDGFYKQMLYAGVSIPAYRLDVSLVNPRQLTDDVDYIEIFATPPLIPFDVDGECDARLEPDDRSDSGAYIRIAFPGISYSNPGETLRRLVGDALPRLDRLEKTVAVIPAKALKDSASKIIEIGMHQGLRELQKSVDSVLRSPVRTLSPLEAELSFPNAFSAATSLRSGDLVFHGDLTLRRFPGYSPLAFATNGIAHFPWEGYVRVTMDDGSTRVSEFSSDGYLPSAYSPLIVYPDRRAREIEIRCAVHDGKARGITCPLTPTPDGSMAFYLATGMDEIEAVKFDEKLSVPAADEPVEEFSGVVAVTSADDPSRLLVAADFGSPVKALLPAGSGSSLEFGRTTLYLCSDAGTSMLSLNAARTALTARRVDDRGVLCATATDDGILAATGSGLLRVRSGRATLLLPDVAFADAAFCHSTGEAWLRDGSGSLTILARDGTFYARDDVKPLSFIPKDGRLYITDGALNTYLADEETGEPVDVGWTARLPLDFLPRLVGVDFAASAFDGTCSLGLDGGRGDAPPAVVARSDVLGAVSSPLRLHVLSRLGRYLSFEITGRASPDARFKNLMLWK